MKKKCTKNILLFSTLALILSTTAKSSEKVNLPNGLLSMAINPYFFGSSGTIRYQNASAALQEASNNFHHRLEEIRQQNAAKGTDDKSSLQNQGKNPDLQPDQTFQKEFLKQFLRHLESKNTFSVNSFDKEDS